MIISNFHRGKANFRRVTVPVPELAQDPNENPEILLQEMSGGEQAQFQSLMNKPEFKDCEKAIVAYMLSISAIREDGNKLFEDAAQAESFIDSVPAGVINRLNKAIWQLNNGQTEKNL